MLIMHCAVCARVAHDMTLFAGLLHMLGYCNEHGGRGRRGFCRVLRRGAATVIQLELGLRTANFISGGAGQQSYQSCHLPYDCMECILELSCKNKDEAVCSSLRCHGILVRTL